VSPTELARKAKDAGSFGIAYTYSEPLIHEEYLLDAARAVREAGLMNVLVSNGYINPEPAEEVLTLMDAANIDLKSFDSEFYRSETGGSLDEVKRFLRQAAGRIHLEVTTLVIPTKNDDPAELEQLAAFVASLSPDIPLHLSCYYPQYKYTIPHTPPLLVSKLAETARRYLRYVYVGNVGNKESNTTCPSCKCVLVRRAGYSVQVEGLRHDTRGDCLCKRCGTRVPIIMTSVGDADRAPNRANDP
jgi:pyruvate formate lyase activating enzyme